MPGSSPGMTLEADATIPTKDKLTVCFAHAAYRMGERFALRNTGLDWFEVRTLDDLKARIGEVDVLLVLRPCGATS